VAAYNVDPATGQPYKNSTYMAQWGSTPSPTRNRAIAPYATGASGVFTDAAGQFQSALDRYLATGEANIPDVPDATKRADNLLGSGWSLKGWETGDNVGFSGDPLTALQSGVNFFNAAADDLHGFGEGGFSNHQPWDAVGGNARTKGGGGMAKKGGKYSLGGVSAVNPQVGDFKQYEDAAFANASGRLDPFLQQQTSQFNQRMANQGIPVGSDAYNKAFAQMNLGQTDAMNNAAFGAMGFGLGAQDQAFGQEHARSQLANSLLQAKMAKQLGMANVGLGQAQLAQQGSQFQDSLGFDREKLAQQGQQFGDTLGYNYDSFYDTLGQRAYEFDSGQDFDYWSQGNAFDLAERGMDTEDYWNAYNAGPTGTEQYDNALIMALLGIAPPGVVPADVANPYSTQITGANANQGNIMDFINLAFGTAKGKG